MHPQPHELKQSFQRLTSHSTYKSKSKAEPSNKFFIMSSSKLYEPCWGLSLQLLFLHLHTLCKLFCNKIRIHNTINYRAVVIEGNRPLQRARSGMLDTLILEDGMYENIKSEAMKRMIQELQLPKAEHQRENVELSSTHFEPVCTLSAVLPRSVA